MDVQHVYSEVVGCQIHGLEYPAQCHALVSRLGQQKKSLCETHAFFAVVLFGNTLPLPPRVTFTGRILGVRIRMF